MPPADGDLVERDLPFEGRTVPDRALAFGNCRKSSGRAEEIVVARTVCERVSQCVQRFRLLGRHSLRHALAKQSGRLSEGGTMSAAESVCVVFGRKANTQPVQN